MALASPAPGVALTETATVFAAVQDSTDSLEELAAKATAAVVLIEVKSGDDSRQGSGFIVDPGGLVLTNHHVIRDATSAIVRLSSGDVYDRVTILAADERRDIAALQIAGFALPSLELGNSDSVRIGSPAIAIGSPLGLENTVSTGIVSGRRQEPEGYQLLQLTAPASTGSSGGPVLSRNGLVIGIAVSQIRGGQNLNFAVPINYARGMLSRIDGDPVATLTTSPPSRARAALDISTADGRVNAGIRLDVSQLEDHRLDYEGQDVGGGLVTTRLTFRRIEDIAGGPPRIERYLESQTSVQRGTLGPPVVIRRERGRSLVSATDLSPVSSRGRVDWQVDGEWRRLEYELRFERGRVWGTIRDSSGVAVQIDRELPPGIVLREMRDLVFASVVADRLVGRSLELVTFDPTAAQITTDRYDVRAESEIEVQGRKHDVLVVDMATGLSNERRYYMKESPRLLLRRERGAPGLSEEMVGLYWYPSPPDPEESGGS